MRLWRMNLGLKTIRTIENGFEITISRGNWNGNGEIKIIHSN